MCGLVSSYNLKQYNYKVYKSQACTGPHDVQWRIQTHNTHEYVTLIYIVFLWFDVGCMCNTFSTSFCLVWRSKYRSHRQTWNDLDHSPSARRRAVLISGIHKWMRTKMGLLWLVIRKTLLLHAYTIFSKEIWGYECILFQDLILDIPSCDVTAQIYTI